MRKRFLAVLVLALTSSFTIVASVNAGEKEDELIAKVVDAYGGDALRNLSSYQIKEKYIGIAYGQSHVPDLNDVNKSSQVLTMNVTGNKTAFDSWSSNRGGSFQFSTISDGEKAYQVDYHSNTYGEANSADPYAFAGGTMRTSDAILVYELQKVAKDAKLLSDTKFRNRPHHVLSMPFPNSPDLNLYIDVDTLLVSRMLRVNPQLGNLDYIFSDYKTNNGIRYASSTQFFIAGNPNLISVERELVFNQKFSDAFFALPEGFKAESDRVDDSEVVVNKVSDRVYHLGQEGGYSLFVDTGDGIVAVGGYPGLQTRFERFKKESKRFKPLNYQVVTHHHSDHIPGVTEAVDLGARLVTVKENVDTLKEIPNSDLGSRDFFIMSSRATFGDGRNRAEIYEVSTSHAASFLVTYVPAEKLVFIADHMGSPFVDATPVAGQGTVDMLRALDALNIDIKKIATAHGARLFSIKDMRDSVSAFKARVCGGERPACSF